MRMINLWQYAVFLGVILSSAAFADVTVSKSNNPKDTIGTLLGALLEVEKIALDNVGSAQKATIAYQVKNLLFAPEPLGSLSLGSSRNFFTADRLGALPIASGGKQWSCLAQAIYFEARGETILGQVAVGEVILNRVESVKYPQTICAVVHQSRNGVCQFSYMCDGKPEKVAELAAYDVAAKIARALLDGAPRTLTQGATYFHAKYASPRWAKVFNHTADIGLHAFYRDPENL